MTKVQYSKLLVARLKKKLADEMRAKSAEDEIFRRGQEERFLGMQQTRVEGTKEERSNVASAVEGLKLQKQEGYKGLKSNLTEIGSTAKEEREKEDRRARELVEHAKGVQSPRVMESQRAVREKNEARAGEVRLEIAEIRKQREAFEAAEEERKRLMVSTVKLEIGSEALQASSSVVMQEREAVREAVRQMQRDGAEIISKEKETRKGELQQNRVKFLKEKSKGARNALTSRKTEEAKEVKKVVLTNRERRSTGLEEAAAQKKRARDLVLEDRRPPVASSASLSPPSNTKRAATERQRGKAGATP